MNQSMEMTNGDWNTEKKNNGEGLTVGDFVKFGHYPQTKDGKDNTPIEWIVLEKDAESALLISRYALDCQTYNSTEESTTWERCTLRNWLNDEFYNRAFRAEEKKSLLMNSVSSDKRPEISRNRSYVTSDRVFVLSITEAETAFISDEARRCAATDYAIQKGVYVKIDSKTDEQAICCWWLRSPGCLSSYASLVRHDGTIFGQGNFVNCSVFAVRPCVRVRLADIPQDPQSSSKKEASSSNQTAGPDRQTHTVSQYVTFGHYPQTKDGKDNTPIEWIILDADDDSALLISRYALDCQPFHTAFDSTTWEQCTLRKWLNNEFYDCAFSAEEKKIILKSNVSADKNPSHSTDPGDATKDSVFLLSIVEASKYFASNEERKCAGTDYAIQRGVLTIDGYTVDGRAACLWWLRSPGGHGDCAAAVLSNGSIVVNGSAVSFSIFAVRPCVRVRLADIPQDPQSSKKEAPSSNQTAGPDRQTHPVSQYVVTFGRYPQTKDGNDNTPIEWIVLEKDAQSALLISRYALDSQRYSAEFDPTTWEECTLRKWLNNEFYNRAFSAEEKKRILESYVRADKNPKYDTNPGNATKDSLFLLSIAEANKYFVRDEERMCAGTDYAIRQGAWTFNGYMVDGRATCWWWLRSPGDRSDYAAYVRSVGSIIDRGDIVYFSFHAVRPCVRVRLI